MSLEQWSAEDGLPLFEGLLERYDAEYFVVGHTPQLPGHIQARFGERLFLADTGMLSSYYRGGRASILEIRDGVFRTIYLEDAAQNDFRSSLIAGMFSGPQMLLEQRD